MKLFNFFKNKEDNEELKKFKEYQKSFDSGEQRWGCGCEMIPTSDDKNVIEVNKQDFKDLMNMFSAAYWHFKYIAQRDDKYYEQRNKAFKIIDKRIAELVEKYNLHLLIGMNDDGEIEETDCLGRPLYYKLGQALFDAHLHTQFPLE